MKEIVTQEVTIHFEGDTYKISVGPDESILDRALDEGIDLPFSCQSGLCTACMGKCTSGKVMMDEDETLTEEEVAEGFVLLCVGHPLTDDVEIEVE
jgi:ring-1,2-phenylacetyl-CoA epoxidase subunit PaaE